jgi:predicted DNA-binding transcriptional regulator AlpA
MRRSFHLDKRAEQILDADSGGDDDELLSTREVATWLGVSRTWLEIGRSEGYGPRFTRLAPRIIGYRRADVVAWLRERTHQSTKEYAHEGDAA